MSGDVEDVRIGLEHMPRAVAVVDVVVDDRDLRGTLGAGVRRRDGDIVVEAEPHRPIAFGVVAGGRTRATAPRCDLPMTRLTASIAAPEASSAIS